VGRRWVNLSLAMHDSRTVLLAGATGTLGRELLSELRRRGKRVRALVRDERRAIALADPRPELAVGDLADPCADLDGACRAAHTVISAAGRSCTTRRLPDRGRFQALDFDGNRRLLEAAIRAGAQRFLYVSILGAQRLRQLEYVDAHERFVELLQESPIQSTVIRANGFFAGYLELLELVTSPGPATLIGSGSAKDNPIHEADLAVACLEALERDERAVDVGGPQIFTRREELELACVALGREPRIVRVPPRILRTGARLLSPVDARRAEVIRFLAAICTIDMVGPPSGQRQLGEYFAAAVAQARR
jgi:uncharacterized protein YbjT (DUF2867 family)